MKHLDELPDILTPQQVATYVGISRRRVYEYCQLTGDAKLESFTIGASRKIEKESMLRWIETQKQKKA